MKRFKKCIVENYTHDKKGSSEAEPKTRDYPGSRDEYALYIHSILLYDKTSLLKTLKKGDQIEFPIDQHFVINGEDMTLSGEGFGYILEIKDLDLNKDDSDLQEIEIVLDDGGADKLIY